MRTSTAVALIALAFLPFSSPNVHAKIYSPWVVSEHIADFSGNWHSFMRHEAFRGRRDHDLTVAVWKYFSARETGLVHTGSWAEPSLWVDRDGEPDPWGNYFTYATLFDPVKNLNSFGMGYCGMQSVMMTGIFTALGYHSRSANIPDPYSHEVPEIFYRGGWHMIDTDERGLVLTPGGEIASLEQAFAHPEWWSHKPFEDAVQFPVHQRFPELVRQGRLRISGYKYRWAPAGHTMDFSLRMGESLTRFWRADSTRYYLGWWDQPGSPGKWLQRNILEHPENMFHHGQRGDYGIIYERPGGGVFRYEPNLGAGWMDYRDGVHDEANVSQDEHGVVGGPGGGWTVFKVWTPYIIVGKNGPDPGAGPPTGGAVLEYGGRGRIVVEVSRDFGSRWERLAGDSAGRVDFTTLVYGRWGYLVRFHLPERARLERLALTTWVQVNPMSLPRVEGKTVMSFRTGDRTGEKTELMPFQADFSTTTDSLNGLAWLREIKNHDRWNLSHRADAATAALAAPPLGGKWRWLTAGGDFNNTVKPEIWVSTSGKSEDLRLLARLERPDWAGHWLSRLDEFVGPPDSIPGGLLLQYRKNVNNVRIYAHYLEPAREVTDSPVEITHRVGGVETTVTVRADSSWTVYGEGENEWIRMRVAGKRRE